MPLREHEYSRYNKITSANFEDLQRCFKIIIERAIHYNIKLRFDGFIGNKKILSWLEKNIPNSIILPTKDKCIVPWYYTSILSSGELFPCCGDFQQAKINSYDFDGIFNHIYLQLIRENISKNKLIKACKSCNYM